MATFRKRGEYQWQVEIRRKGWPYQTATFETKAEAELWASTIESEMGRGLFIDRSLAERLSVMEALERYRDEVTVTKEGREQEITKIGKLLRHPIALRSLASIRPQDIANLRDEMLKDGAAAATVHRYLAIVSHMFTIATKEWGMYLVNPVQMIRKPKIDNARNRRLDEIEEDYLIRALADSGKGLRANIWILPIVIVALETGMRQSEILRLEWKDVILADNMLVVRKSKGRKKEEPRGVPLSDSASKVFHSLPRPISSIVFPTTASAVKQSWRRAVARGERNYQADCKAQGIDPFSDFLDDVHFHDLRHEATSRFFESGKFDVMEVASITGHKTLAMLKRYTHLKAKNLAMKMRGEELNE